MDVTWNDDYNTPFSGSLNLTPSSGDKNKSVSVSDGVNEGLDRHVTVVVQSDVDPTLMEEVVIKQKGTRIPFCTGDGVPFRTGDTGTFNVLKP